MNIKKLLSIIFFILILYSCEDDFENKNSFLPNIPVDFTVNLNLPEGNSLRVYGYEIYKNKGIRGVIIFNDGLSYHAFDLACPHISLQDCSTMTFNQTDLYLKCPCDNEEFSRIDGAPKNNNILYAAKSYFVIRNGDILHIKN